MKMEQLNNDLPETKEEMKSAVEVAFVTKPEAPLLSKVRQKFGVYGGISLLFGGFFALLFYKTWLGINAVLFICLTIALLFVIMKKLSLQVKTGTKFYFTGAILLSVSTFFTSSEILQFLNSLGILLLLDASLLHQFYDNQQWDFSKHFSKLISLPFYSIAEIGLPFIDSANFLKKIKFLKNNLLRNVFLGLIISLPLLFIITALLSDADLLFGELTKGIFNTMFSADQLAFSFMLILGFLVCYCVLCGTLSKVGMEEKKAFTKADASIAITFMISLCLIYAVFCTIQLIYLFANGFFALPQTYTFAEYARRGFFELLAVTIINISIMLLCRALFQESKWLRILVTFMTGCTYIMIASATYRMLLYIGAYHLTFLRLFVLLSLLIDGFVLAGVIISEYNRKFPLFQYSAAVMTVCYLAFSFARPDCYIVSYLSEQKEILELEDMRYLTYDLSLDAAPYVLALLNDTERWEDTAAYSEEALQEHDKFIENYYNRIQNVARNMGVRDFNYSNYKAVINAEKYPAR